MNVVMLDPSGANPYGAHLASALARQGVDLTLLLSRSFVNPGAARCNVRLVAPRHAQGQAIRKGIEEALYLFEIVRASARSPRPLIHVQWIRVGLEVHLLAAIRASGARIVVTAHNIVPHEPSQESTRRLQKIYDLATRIIVHDAQSRQSLTELFDIPLDRVSVIPIGCEGLPKERIVPSEVARRRLQLPANAVIFTSFGIVRPYKGYDELIPAFGIAARCNARIALLIAGHATALQHQHLQSLVGQLDQESRERVFLRLSTAGPLAEDQVDDVFAASDCVVLPYRAISQSAVALQAQSYGRALLAFGVGGLPDVVVDGVNGRLVKPGDVEGLAAGMRTLGDCWALLRDWGKAGRRLSEEKFGWDLVATETIGVYREALGEGCGGLQAHQ